MRRALWAGAAAAALLGLVWLYAAMLPVTRTITREGVIAAPVDRVFALVTDVGNQPRWRRDIAQVVVAADGAAWTEQPKRGAAIHFRTVRQVPDSLFEIAYESPQGFSGQWIGRFSAREAGDTLIRIEETTTTASPLGRLLARLFAPPGSHAELYLEDLGRAIR